ncbi:MAG: Uma2 family endonuclease, partial [Bacteroidota bacterium]
MTQVLESPILVSDFEWTLTRYHEAIKNGTFTPADKLELLHGKLVKKMSINPPHSSCLKKLNKFFNRRFLDVYELMSENPITLTNNSEPEPDFAIVNLDKNDYQAGHPTAKDIHLVVEIAD